MSEFKLRQHQQKAVDDTVAELAFGSNLPIINAPTSFGKEQPYSEPVLTSSGWKTMGTLLTEDMVIGSDGLPKKITHFHEQGAKDVYEIKFKDGSFVRCGLDHLWTVHKYATKQQNNSKISYLKKITKSVEELLLYSENSISRFFVKLPSIVRTKLSNEILPELTLDPYLLGLLLGDGTFRSSTIGFSNRNKHIRDALLDLLPDNDTIGFTSFSNDGNKVDINIVTKIKYNKQRSCTSIALEKMGLLFLYSTEKFIPDEYKYGSYYTRQKILQGLLDTDGHSQTATLNEYSSSSKRLANDVLEIARSLGIYANISSRIPTYTTQSGEKKQGSRSYRVFLNFSRKKKGILSIKKLDYTERSRCITIDSSDSLYITRDYTLTHNSSVIAGLCRDLEKESIVILVNITELIDQIAEHLDHLNIDYSILKAGRESEFDISKRVHVVMSHTLFARIEKIDLKCDIVIQDEIHREFDTSRTKTILDKLKPYSRIGLSATPFDSNCFKLDGAEIIHTMSIMELQNQGYLSKIKYFIPKWSEKIDYSSIKSTGSDYTISKLDEIVATHKHIEQSIASMNKLNAKEKKTIVFCSSIEQCELVTDALIKDGYKAGCTHSKMHSLDNENIISAFKHGTKYIAGDKSQKNKDGRTLFIQEDTYSGSDITCLVSVSKLSIGFDVKDIQLGVLMRPTKVYSLFLQQVGRVVRIAPGKTHGEILDLAQCTSRFGFHTTQFSPLERTGDKNIDKANKLALDRDMELPHLSETLDDGLEEFDFDKYELSIQKLEAKEKLIQDKKNNISNWTMRELASAYDYTDNIFTVISIGAEIYIRKFGNPISKKGYPYEYDPKWITNDIFTAFEKYPEKKRQWIKAYKTRTRNIIKKEQNFNALKFFIDFLVDKYESELDLEKSYKTVYTKGCSTQNQSDVPEVYIDEEDIPF